MTTKEEITQIVNSCNCYNRDTGEWGFDNATAIEKLSIFAVSSRRELLLGLLNSMSSNQFDNGDYADIVDNYLAKQ